MKAWYLFAVLAIGCGAQKEKEQKGYTVVQSMKAPTFGKNFDAIPVQKGYGKPIPPFPWFGASATVPAVKPGERVWSPVPVGGAWDIVNYSIATVEKVRESRVHLNASGVSFVVPGVMVQPFRRPKGRIKKGDTVLTAVSMSSEWGKVTGTTRGKVLVSMVWAREIRKEEVPVERVLLLDGKKPVPGMPVVFSSARSWEFGLLIHRTRARSLIIGYAGKLVNTRNDNVRLVPVGVRHPMRGRVWTLWYATMEEARIEKVLDGGTGYLVRFPERPAEPYRNPRLVSFARIVKPQG